MGRGTRDLGAQENKPSEGVIKTISRRHYYHAPKKYHMYANKRAGNLGLQAPGGVLGQGDEACIPHRLGTGTFMSGQESQLCNIMLQGCVSGHTLYISSARSHRPAGHNNTPVRGSSPSAPLSPCPPTCLHLYLAPPVPQLLLYPAISTPLLHPASPCPTLVMVSAFLSFFLAAKGDPSTRKVGGRGRGRGQGRGPGRGPGRVWGLVPRVCPLLFPVARPFVGSLQPAINNALCWG